MGIERRALAAAGLALVLGGCAATQDVAVERVSAEQYAPTSVVEVLQRAPARPYQLIARLDASGAAGTPVAQVLASLQAKAAALGANAIVVQDLSTRQQGTLQLDPSGGQMTQTAAQVVPHLKAQALRYTGN
ncbi:hypothetical protein GALL_326980 [mine drainage metagenome]|jgi:hypothetical protein|uniref:Lipoprotein n=1 Tax=mine drainage metagenome TaxID=410659 RepID=A0A1J5QQ15_9ZZZZ